MTDIGEQVDVIVLKAVCAVSQVGSTVACISYTLTAGLCATPCCLH